MMRDSTERGMYILTIVGLLAFIVFGSVKYMKLRDENISLKNDKTSWALMKPEYDRVNRNHENTVRYLTRVMGVNSTKIVIMESYEGE